MHAAHRKGGWTTLPDIKHGSAAYGLDDNDDAVGRIFGRGAAEFPVIWPRDQTFMKIRLPYSSPYGVAESISPSGAHVVGTALGGGCFEWQGSGVASDLGDLGGDYCAAHAVNDAGQVAGQANVVPGGSTHAFLVTQGRPRGALPRRTRRQRRRVVVLRKGIHRQRRSNHRRRGLPGPRAHLQARAALSARVPLAVSRGRANAYRSACPLSGRDSVYWE